MNLNHKNAITCDTFLVQKSILNELNQKLNHFDWYANMSKTVTLTYNDYILSTYTERDVLNGTVMIIR